MAWYSLSFLFFEIIKHNCFIAVELRFFTCCPYASNGKVGVNPGFRLTYASGRRFKRIYKEGLLLTLCLYYIG